MELKAELEKNNCDCCKAIMLNNIAVGRISSSGVPSIEISEKRLKEQGYILIVDEKL